MDISSAWCHIIHLIILVHAIFEKLNLKKCNLKRYTIETCFIMSSSYVKKRNSKANTKDDQNQRAILEKVSNVDKENDIVKENVACEQHIC